MVFLSFEFLGREINNFFLGYLIIFDIIVEYFIRDLFFFEVFKNYCCIFKCYIILIVLKIKCGWKGFFFYNN